MMNPSQIAEALKTAPDQYLAQAISGSIPTTPGYLALAEMRRRQAVRDGAAQAPMTTVVQDQGMQMPAPQQRMMQPQMAPSGTQPFGIGASGGQQQATRKFAAGGAVESESPTRSIFSGLQQLASYIRDRDAEYREHLRNMRNPNGDLARSYFQLYEPNTDAPDVPLIEPPYIDDAKAAMPPGTSTRVSASTRTRTAAPTVGIGAAAPAVRPAVTVPPLEMADSNSLLSRVPTSKILEALAKDAQIDPKAFEKRRGDARTDGMLQFAARIASRPGGFGGNFAAAVNEGNAARRQSEKEIRADERQAKMDERAILLAQAQEEANRYRTAQDLAKTQYDVAANNYTRQTAADKNVEDANYRDRALAQALQIAREANAAHLQQARISAEARNAGVDNRLEIADLQAMVRVRSAVAQQAEKEVGDIMRRMELSKKYGTKDPAQIKDLRARELYQEAVSTNPRLLALEREVSPGTMPGPAVPGISMTDTPNGPIRPR